MFMFGVKPIDIRVRPHSIDMVKHVHSYDFANMFTFEKYASRDTK